MPDDLPDGADCFFPACKVERIGNVVMIHTESDDDAIIVFEMFKDVSLGHTISFRKAD